MDDTQIISLLRNLLNKSNQNKLVEVSSEEKQALRFTISKLLDLQDDRR